MVGARDRDHHDVLEPDDLDADRGDAVHPREAVQLGLDQLGEARPAQHAAGDGQQARARAVALGLGIEGDEALGDEHAQDVQTRARDQRERAGDRVDAERLVAPAEQAEDGHRARHRGNRAHAPPHPVASRRFVPDRGHGSSRVALPSSVVVIQRQCHIDNPDCRML